MNEITLSSLILEHRERIKILRFKPNPKGCLGFAYYYYEDAVAYQKWLAMTKRFLALSYPNDKDVIEFEQISKTDLSPTQQKKLLAILEALSLFPTVIPNKQIDSSHQDNDIRKEAINITTTINNSQSQTQEQSLAVQLFVEAIKDELTGRQIKELKSIVEEAGSDLQKARFGILTKIKELGLDVASNILANIITNPSIWTGW